MWRNANAIRKVPATIGRNILQQPSRNASSGGFKTVSKLLSYTIGLGVTGTGAAVAYAYVDPEARRTIEKYIPQAKEPLQKLLGDPRDKPAIDLSSVKQITDKVTGLIPAKKEEKVAPPSVQSSGKPAVESKPAAPPKVEAKADKSEKAPAASSAQIESKPTTAVVTPKEKVEKSEKVTPLKNDVESNRRDISDEEKLRIKLQEAKAEYEEELTRQMRRQVAAHTEHLEEALLAQKAQLEAQCKRELDEAVINERDSFNRELALSIARLRAIETALEGRAEQDSENRRAKELWLACQHLRKAVLHGRAEGRDYSARRKPLTKEITAIKEAGAADPFIKTLVNAVNAEAVSQGVFTQDDLVDRFQKVRKVCRRTALIGDNGGTLFQYFLSYLQSMFLFDRVKPDPKQLQEIDPSNIDTVGILWRASHLVEQLDFDAAIKLMLLLKGEPARLASDWIRDARLHLETRRTAELLLAHASAISMRTIY